MLDLDESYKDLLLHLRHHAFSSTDGFEHASHGTLVALAAPSPSPAFGPPSAHSPSPPPPASAAPITTTTSAPALPAILASAVNFNYSSMARTIQFNRVVRPRIKPCPIPCLNPTSTRLIGSGLTWIREKSFLSTNPFQRASLQVQSWSHCSLPHHLSQPLQREPATPLANLWQTTLLGTKKRNRSM